MKKSFLHLVILCILGFHAQAQDRVFYYDEQGGKIYLEKDSNVKFIHFSNAGIAQNNSLLRQL